MLSVLMHIWSIFRPLGICGYYNLGTQWSFFGNFNGYMGNDGETWRGLSGRNSLPALNLTGANIGLM